MLNSSSNFLFNVNLFIQIYHFFILCPALSNLWIISIFRHRVVNIFLRSYYELWLQDENVGQEVMIEDLTVRFAFTFKFICIFK